MPKLYGPLKKPRSWYTKKFPNTNVEGFETVMINLNIAIAAIKKASERGLLNAAYFIRNKTEKETAATPLDLGNLRASWFVTYSKGLAKDPNDRYTGKFKTNPKRRITAAKFQGWHQAAIAEASGMSAPNPKRATVVMGYSANYAMWVHENLGAHFTTRSPAAGPKWFQEAIDRNQGKIIQIVRETSKAPLR
jgi:hypothetical protein